jgi:hypothetical protein
VAAADAAYYAGMATRDAAIKAADIAFYSGVAASAVANGVGSSEFVRAGQQVGTHA